MVRKMYIASGKKMYHKNIVMQHSVFYIADSDMYINNTHRKHYCVFTSKL